MQHSTDVKLGMDMEKLSLPLVDCSGHERQAQPNGRKGWQQLRVWLVLVLVGSGAVWFNLGESNWYSSCKGKGKPKPPIEWKTCEENKLFKCGYFHIPTDHFNPSIGTTKLWTSLLSANTSTGPRLGTIYTNYGGPGVPGAQVSLQGIAEMIQNLVGGRYDIVSWDPRGIGKTIPRVECYSFDPEGQGRAIGNTVLERIPSISPDPWSERGKAELIMQQREAIALMKMQGGLCDATMGKEVLKYMGTTTLIRDMQYIKDWLDGEEELINFHGGSYGTIVADYLVNMLPNKTGKVIAHGVADPEMWATHHFEDYTWINDLLENADISYQRFLTSCHSSGPNRCPLTIPSDKSWKDLKSRVDTYLIDLWEQGGVGVITGNGRHGILTDGMVRSTLFETIQSPSSWQRYSSYLSQAISGNPELLFNRATSRFSKASAARGQGDLMRLGVSCADSLPYGVNETLPTGESTAQALLDGALKTSRMFGGSVQLMEQHGFCQYWPKSEEFERFTGPWNSTLKIPMLVSSNTHDPITPVSQGRKMAMRHGSSARHIIQNTTGHSYLSEPTECYAKICKTYFEEGVLPDEFETFCDSPEADNFPENGLGLSMDIERDVMGGLWGL